MSFSADLPTRDYLMQAFNEVSEWVRVNPGQLSAVPIHGELELYFRLPSFIEEAGAIVCRTEHLARLTYLLDDDDRPKPQVLFASPEPFHPLVLPGRAVNLDDLSPDAGAGAIVDYLARLLTYRLPNWSTGSNHRAVRWLHQHNGAPPWDGDQPAALRPPTDANEAGGRLWVRGRRDAGANRSGSQADTGSVPSNSSPYADPLRTPTTVPETRRSRGLRAQGPIRQYHPAARVLPAAFLQPVERHSDQGSIKVFMQRSALDQIWLHARRDIENEGFGILVGRVWEDPLLNMTWVEVERMLAADRVRAGRTFVEVPAEELCRLSEQVDRLIAQIGRPLRRIGWYHTHPGHGVFMSSVDQDNHRRAYQRDYHVALVVDPIRRQYGLFAGTSFAVVAVEDFRIIEDSLMSAAAALVDEPQAGVPRWVPTAGEVVPEHAPATQSVVAPAVTAGIGPGLPQREREWCLSWWLRLRAVLRRSNALRPRAVPLLAPILVAAILVAVGILALAETRDAQQASRMAASEAGHNLAWETNLPVAGDDSAEVGYGSTPVAAASVIADSIETADASAPIPTASIDDWPTSDSPAPSSPATPSGATPVPPLALAGDPGSISALAVEPSPSETPSSDEFIIYPTRQPKPD